MAETGSLRLAGSLALMFLATPPSAYCGDDGLKAAEKALTTRFKGKLATPKIDLPWRRSLYVDLDGKHDEARYYERLRDSEKVLSAGTPLPIHKLEADDDHINVCIGGPQCGQAWKPKSSKTVAVFGGPGFRIEIEFGRKVTAADLSSEVVLKALSRVLSIEGEVPPTEFSPAAVLGAAPVANGPPAASPPAAHAPTSSAANLSPPSGTAAPATLVLLSAEVQPTDARPGSRLKLVAHFEVSGSKLPVTEERQILKDDRALFSKSATTTQDWAPGRHTTEFEFTLPPKAPEGIYTYRLTLRGGGAEHTKQALFVVK